MTAFALLLVFASAVIHATWNTLAKRVHVTAAGTWLLTVLSALFYAPVALVVLWTRHAVIGPRELTFIGGTAVLQAAYFLFLTAGYRVGDLSFVYPVARGTGPMLSTIGAIVVYGERPSILALIGTVLIGSGVLILARTGGQAARQRQRAAVGYALLTGALIAAYTLWDKYAVSVVRLHPILLDWGGGLGRSVLLAPLAIRGWEAVRRHLRQHPLEFATIAVLISLSYILVLSALVFTPVSYVAPLRETSIIIGTAMGARLFAEGDATRRLIAASLIVCGAVALGIG